MFERKNQVCGWLCPYLRRHQIWLICMHLYTVCVYVWSSWTWFICEFLMPTILTFSRSCSCGVSVTAHHSHNATMHEAWPMKNVYTNNIHQQNVIYLNLNLKFFTIHRLCSTHCHIRFLVNICQPLVDIVVLLALLYWHSFASMYHSAHLLLFGVSSLVMNAKRDKRRKSSLAMLW